MDIERVKYENCPLVEVVFQVDFPTILSIDVNEPAQFQELIRDKFPNYFIQTQQEGQVYIGFDEETTVVNKHRTKKLHTFISYDGKWKLVLAKDMLFLSTIAYSIWEDMAARFEEPIKAFVQIYRPAYFSRVGLRYIDSFEKGQLGLAGTEWSDLFKPHILGCLNYHTEDNMIIKTSTINAEIVFDDVVVNIETGMGTVDHHDGKPPANAFILNCDYYSIGKYDAKDLNIVAVKLHQRSHVFFRESITDKLHLAMKPTGI